MTGACWFSKKLFIAVRPDDLAAYQHSQQLKAAAVVV